MMQVIPQTRDEKVAMYMKLTKRELVEMLLNNQDFRDRLLEEKHKAADARRLTMWNGIPVRNRA